MSQCISPPLLLHAAAAVNETVLIRAPVHPTLQIARKLLGSRWQLSSGMQFKPPTASNGGKLLTLQDYKRRQGLA